MGRKALQFVHDRPDILRALGNLDTHRALDAHAQRVTVLVGRQVVEPVGERKHLRIGQALAHLLDSAMNITAVRIDLLDDLALERDAEMEHAVRSRVLRSDVDDIFRVVEQHVLARFDPAVLLDERRHRIGHRLALETDRIDLGRSVVILAQRESDPVAAQIEPAHVGMAYEANAEKVVRFPLVQVGRLPNIRHGRKLGIFLFGRRGLQHDLAARRRRAEVVDYAERIAPVHARQADQKVELHPGIVSEFQRRGPQLRGRNGHRQRLALGKLGRRRLGRQYLSYVIHGLHHCLRLLFSPFCSRRRRNARLSPCAATASCRRAKPPDAGGTPARTRRRE